MTEKIQKSNFKKLCRICLLQSTQNQLVTSDIIEKLEICTSVKILLNDGLPAKICESCKQNTEKFYEFKLKCKESDKLLKSVLNGLEEQKPSWEELDIKYLIPVVTISDQPIKKENELSSSNNFDLDDDGELKTNNKSTSLPVNDIFDDGLLDDIKTETDENDDDISPVLSDTQADTKEEIHSKESINTETRKPTHACHICNKEFSEKSNLTKHILRHKGVPKYTCDCCSKGFYELSALSVHMKQHDVTPLTCSECQKQFLLKLQLDLHFSKYHEEKRHTCETCGKTFRMKSLLKSHELSHTKRDLYSCSRCDKWFKYETSLKTHVRNAHEGPKKKDICTVCGKEVMALKYHMLKVHATDRPHKCEHCGKAFAVLSLLKIHLKVHTGESRLYKVLCTVCGKKCESSTSLHVHMRSHTGERPLACPMCDKTYKTPSTLAVHRRSHTGERPHECQVCHKRFLTKSCIKRHSLVHTSEKHYQCNICGREFGQNSTLKTHMKIH